jgi:hypothetical protein
LCELIDFNIHEIAQDIKSRAGERSEYENLKIVMHLEKIGACYLACAKREAKERAFATLKGYGIPVEKLELALSMTLGAYILEKCVEAKQLDKSFLYLFKKLQEEYEEFKREYQ